MVVVVRLSHGPPWRARPVTIESEPVVFTWYCVLASSCWWRVRVALAHVGC